MKSVIKISAASIAFCLTAIAPSAASSDATPLNKAKPVNLVVGYAPGGAADGVTRIFAQALQDRGWGNVIVENKPGASSQIALDYVKRSPPDGHAILIAPGSLFSVNPLVYEKLTYDADKDLVPLATLTINPAAVSVGQGKYADVGEFISAMKRDPALANVAVSTVGSPLYLGVLALSDQIGAKIEPVLYRGASQGLTDLMGGQISAVADALASQLQFHQGGKIKIIGVSGSARAASAPEIPTLKEQGYDQFEYATNWYAAFVPASTPADVRAFLEKELIVASQQPHVRESLAKLGVESAGLSGAETTDRVKTERSYWAPIVQKSGFKVTQ